MGLLFDTGIDVDTEVWQYNYNTTKQSWQYAPTNVDARQFTNAYSLQYSPSLVISSPYATLEGASLTPMVSQAIPTTPITSTTQADIPTVEPVTFGSETGDPFSSLVVIGVVALGAYVAYKVFKGKKPRKKGRK